MELLQRFEAGDIRALSRVISRIEDSDEGYRELLGALYRKAGKTLKIGITGPPGAGKSTLVNCLAHAFLARGQRIGIVAIDPSSPFTGGALLGDRVRMNEFPSDGSVYFRSMATRGASGGLSQATNNVTVVLDAFGFNVVLIETVGVGQIELDIVDTCDVTVVAVVPESGDAVQTLKAGLMEIAQIMVVNKADRPGAESVVNDLRQTFKLRKPAEGDWKVPVVSTEAVYNKGIDQLMEKIDAFVEYATVTGKLDQHRRSRLRRMILNILSHRFQREFLDRVAADVGLDKIIDDVCHGKADPYQVSEQLYERFACD
ncbi:MAG TPA: methylmalonyl Co-A mutase-associated GTPase MeaB [candidate division Zixibacteria bacterium]|nr:methylmalonyl Co-A mutase-associated GTPase MeaB [candidate division Zixibacteria bacterium]